MSNSDSEQFKEERTSEIPSDLQEAIARATRAVQSNLFSPLPKSSEGDDTPISGVREGS